MKATVIVWPLGSLPGSPAGEKGIPRWDSRHCDRIHRMQLERLMNEPMAPFPPLGCTLREALDLSTSQYSSTTGKELHQGQLKLLE